MQLLGQWLLDPKREEESLSSCSATHAKLIKPRTELTTSVFYPRCILVAPGFKIPGVTSDGYMDCASDSQLTPEVTRRLQ